MIHIKKATFFIFIYNGKRVTLLSCKVVYDIVNHYALSMVNIFDDDIFHNVSKENRWQYHEWVEKTWIDFQNKN